MNHDLHQVRAADVMSKTLHWTSAQENLRVAAQSMKRNGVRALLVAGDRPGDLPGILTSKDVVNLLGRQDPEVLGDLRVCDVMTRPAICVPKQANLVDCINLMRMAGVRRVPVLDGATVVGLLSSSDVFSVIV
jgi:CBS domain-containing protein